MMVINYLFEITVIINILILKDVNNIMEISFQKYSFKVQLVI